MTIKAKFADVRKQYAGQILIHNYGDKSLAFSPLTMAIDSQLRCECGQMEWNATNFGNSIHFCPNREYTFEVTNYRAIN